jgi:hypothetical protein
MFYFWCIVLGISSHPEGALPGTLRNAGVGAAPAGGGRRCLTHSGGHWVPARPITRTATEAGWTRDRRAVRNRRAQARKGRRVPGSADQDLKIVAVERPRGVSAASVFPSRKACCGTNYIRRAFRRSTSLLIFEGGFLKPHFTQRNLRAAMTLVGERSEMYQRAPQTPRHTRARPAYPSRFTKSLSKRMDGRVKPYGMHTSLRESI